jgi:ABC-type multidrug transport system fused ATPase/permease subunit
VFGVLVFLLITVFLTRGILFAFLSYSKSVQLHNKMFNSVIYARMAFFDSTPIGRILNAFARHQYAIDSQLADSLFQFLQFAPICLWSMIIVVVYMWPTIGVLLGASIVAGSLMFYLGGVENKLKNKDAVTKSTIFSHLTATLEGLFSIRAYECQERFVDAYMNKVDENHAYQFSMMQVKTWLAFYLDVLTSFMIYTTTIIIVELADQYPATACGLVLSNILQLLVFLQWTIRMFGEVLEKLGSIKQVAYYGNAVTQEALPIIEDKRPPADWPSHGHIEFTNVVLKYQEFGVAVLKNVNLHIKSKEKVGIVGRTGSGKSTLLISLLRIVELADGEISIDGLDVSPMGLRDLRSRIAIIPQEPILFVGTIRENIDLFGKNTDEEIWVALDSVHLGHFIRKLEQKLNSPVIGKLLILFILFRENRKSK